MAAPVRDTINGPEAWATLQSWNDRPGELTGQAIHDGALMALIMAETLAVNFQIQPPLVITERGAEIPALGSARGILHRMPEQGQILYLGTYGAVRGLHRSVRYPWGWKKGRRWNVPGIGVPIGVFIIGGVGLAAAIMGGWYYKAETRKTELIVDGEKARAAAVASAAVQMATPYIQAGQPVPASILAPLQQLAKVERVAGSSWAPPLAVGLGVGAVAGAVIYERWIK